MVSLVAEFKLARVGDVVSSWWSHIVAALIAHKITIYKYNNNAAQAITLTIE